MGAESWVGGAMEWRWRDETTWGEGVEVVASVSGCWSVICAGTRGRGWGREWLHSVAFGRIGWRVGA
jgi:hypothetical protein